MLGSFYKDKQKYASLFQIYALFTRIKKLFKVILDTDKKILIVERSPFSDFHGFTQVNKDEGNIDDFGYIVYGSLYNFIVNLIGILTPDVILYLRLDPADCYERLKFRDRKEESTVDLNYLTALHNKHDYWLKESNIVNKKTTTLIIIDSKINYRDNDENLNTIYNQMNITI
jgi:deoxyadenosine/deoxycytidine kinase